MRREFIFPAALCGIALFLIACGDCGTARPSWNGEWPREVLHPITPPVGPKFQEWSPWEIARRHQSRLMAELPTYIENLRGAGPKKQTPTSGGKWVFTVPKERTEDFTKYLMILGVTEESLVERTMIFPPNWLVDESGNWSPPPPPPDPRNPAKELQYLGSNQQQADDDIFSLSFPKDGAMMYFFHNPNIERSRFVVRFARSNGNVEVFEADRRTDRDAEDKEEE